MKVLIIVLLLLNWSCTNKKGEEVFSIQQHAIDSFRLVDFMDTREQFNLSYLNDSEVIGFSNNKEFLCVYTKQGYDFVRSDSIFIPNSFYFNAFFVDHAHNVHVIGRDSQYSVNKWYTLDFQNRAFIFQHFLDFGLPVLKHFRIFHLQHQPVIVDDSSFILDIDEIDPYTFEKALREKNYVRLFRKGDSIHHMEQFLNKSATLISQVIPYNIHCQARSKVLTIFPCIDSIYVYDLATKKSECIPIRNPNFSPPLPYDRKRWMEADYNTETRIHSFYYQGIFFNEKTKHLVLFYTTPADKDVRVPTDEDKQFYALVLDTNYQFIKNVHFVDRFWSTGKFFNTKQGIYMPHYTKKVRDEKKCTYYLFDL